MSDTRKYRELIDLIAARVEDAAPLDETTVGVVLFVLDSHYLLRDFEGSAEEYHRRVQQAYADALRAMELDG